MHIIKHRIIVWTDKEKRWIEDAKDEIKIVWMLKNALKWRIESKCRRTLCKDEIKIVLILKNTKKWLFESECRRTLCKDEIK